MHPVLDLETDWAEANQNEALKQTLSEACFRCCLAHDNWTELAVITNKHNLLCSHRKRDQRLSFNGLCCLVNDNLTEPKVFEARVSSTNTSAANDIRSLQDLALCAIAKCPILFLIAFRQFTHFSFEALKFVELLTRCQRCHDVKTEMVHRTCGCLSSLGCKTDHSQASRGNFFRQLIHGHVRGSSHQNLAHILPSEVINQRGRCHGLASPRRPLNQTHRTLKYSCDSLNLTLIQRWETRSGEIFRIREFWVCDELLFNRVSQKFVIDITSDTGIVNGEIFEGILHAVEGRGFPNVLHDEVIGDFPWKLYPRIGIGPSPATIFLSISPLAFPPTTSSNRRTQFEFHLTINNILDITHCLPWRSI
mmetsp:Transcript_34/g.71  ORF Transcript_34/g.71 Transcript_34/m.71 type:complete len:364 (-) Transcript_34:1105-2196(-)